MVRLKDASELHGTAKIIAFQFHNGSIKSEKNNQTELLANICFNSTMVRLKVHFAGEDDNGVVMFQFHNGSIKRCDNG